MSLTIEDVRKVARLARLAMTDQEVTEAHGRLLNIFNLVEELQAIDTRGIEPMSHALNVVQRLRPDAVTETSQRELLQSVAPQVENGLYLVPQVIE